MKILIPTDGSPASLEAVRYALKLIGNGLATSVLLGNVQEPATLYERITATSEEEIREISAEAGLHLLAPAETLLTSNGVDFEIEVASGAVATTLCDMADRFECDLIVMSSRGHGSIANALLGSVSTAVLEASRVPVLMVKGAHGEV
ncbi:MAG: universal stress protein UspA [Rhizobacter sp.]|nr:universal stress protein UspA [Rhizobacter sp.]